MCAMYYCQLKAAGVCLQGPVHREGNRQVITAVKCLLWSTKAQSVMGTQGRGIGVKQGSWRKFPGEDEP